MGRDDYSPHSFQVIARSYNGRVRDIAFTAIIEPDEGGYHAYVPALPGCHTFGETIEEARINLIEAIELHVESMQAHGEAVPLGL